MSTKIECDIIKRKYKNIIGKKLARNSSKKETCGLLSESEYDDIYKAIADKLTKFNITYLSAVCAESQKEDVPNASGTTVTTGSKLDMIEVIIKSPYLYSIERFSKLVDFIAECVCKDQRNFEPEIEMKSEQDYRHDINCHTCKYHWSLYNRYPKSLLAYIDKIVNRQYFMPKCRSLQDVAKLIVTNPYELVTFKGTDEHAERLELYYGYGMSFSFAEKIAAFLNINNASDDAKQAEADARAFDFVMQKTLYVPSYIKPINTARYFAVGVLTHTNICRYRSTQLYLHVYIPLPERRRFTKNDIYLDKDPTNNTIVFTAVPNNEKTSALRKNCVVTCDFEIYRTNSSYKTKLLDIRQIHGPIRRIQPDDAILNSLSIKSYYRTHPLVAALEHYLRSTLNKLFLSNKDMVGDLLPELISKYPFIKDFNENSKTTNEQRTALCKLYNNNISILTGYPGTGKTYLLTLLARMLISNSNKVLVLASTGKAVSNIKKHFIKSDLIQFKTVQKYIRVSDLFIPDLIIIDECSMIPYDLWYGFLSKSRSGRHRVVLTGDPKQLPPIGTGELFADMVQIYPSWSIKLTEVLRQQTGSLAGIITLMGDYSSFERNPDFIKLLKVDNNITYNTLHYDYDNVIITPKNIQRQEINAYMQNKHNKEGQVIPYSITSENGYVFKIGDPIIYDSQTDYEEDTYRGEIYKIEALINNNVVIVRKYDNRRLKVELQDLYTEYKPAYCLTVHKAQGDQWKHVQIYLPENAYMLNKRMIYTAISRAEESASIITNISVDMFKEYYEKDECILTGFKLKPMVT